MKKLTLPSTKTNNKLDFILIKRNSYTGFWNMKIDGYIFENFEKLVSNPDESVIGRFYTFSNHTITLGYFQKMIPEEIKKEFNKWFFVRRITGGKAVFHYPKKDLTFCMVSSLNILDKLNVNYRTNLIESIHSFISDLLWDSISPLITTLKDAQKQDIQINKSQKKYINFDCFENIYSFEKTYNNQKVIGTAIKISNTKFIIQSNIKMNYLFSKIDEELLSSIENNFILKITTLNSECRYIPSTLFDLIPLKVM
ncbi:MAG: hypothetical protein ABDH21_01040 [bacterium]